MDRLRSHIVNPKPHVERNVFSDLPSLEGIKQWMTIPNKSARFENPAQIFSPVNSKHFKLLQIIDSIFADMPGITHMDHDIYGGLTDKPTAKDVHVDQMHVMITQVYGKTPWRIFPKQKKPETKSILSVLLCPGDCLIIPTGYWHRAYPNEPRIAFSTGWV